MSVTRCHGACSDSESRTRRLNARESDGHSLSESDSESKLPEALGPGTTATSSSEIHHALPRRRWRSARRPVTVRLG